MVRWFHGLYGGLIAGGASAVVSAGVAVAWLHETTFEAFFAQVAQALPPFHGAPAVTPLVALGVLLYLIAGAVFGTVYALLAGGQPSMWRAPGSVLWGASYGLFVWWVLNDVVVPVTGVQNVQPLWEGLLGSVVAYGLVLSEFTTVVHRRQAAEGPAAKAVAP
jgi:hypothetical protein